MSKVVLVRPGSTPRMIPIERDQAEAMVAAGAARAVNRTVYEATASGGQTYATRDMAAERPKQSVDARAIDTRDWQAHRKDAARKFRKAQGKVTEDDVRRYLEAE